MIFGDQWSLNRASLSAKLIGAYVTSVLLISRGPHLDLEDRQGSIRRPLGGSGNRSRPPRAHPRVEARGVRIGLDDHNTRADGSNAIEGVAEHLPPDTPSVPARIDPEVLERPALAPRLQRIERDQLALPRPEIDELPFRVLRRDAQDRRPRRQPRFRVTPVRFRRARDLGQALRVAGQRASDSKLHVASATSDSGPAAA